MPTLPDPDDLVPLVWRRRLYDVCTAAVPVLVLWGVVTDAEALVYLGVVAAGLGFRGASHYAGKGPGT